MHTSDEIDILNYLKCFPGTYVSGPEICPRATNRQRYRDNPRWAIPIIISLLVRGFVESNEYGQYRILKRHEVKITQAELPQQTVGEEVVHRPEENLPPPEAPPGAPAGKPTVDVKSSGHH